MYSKWCARACLGLGVALCMSVPAVVALAEVPRQAAKTSTNAETVRLELDLKGAHRSPSNRSRDLYRHPAETLRFFDVQPQHTVVEIWPGGGWYTEILAPWLRDKGVYYAAGFALSTDQTPSWRKKYQLNFLKKLQAEPAVYDHVVVTELSVPERTTIAPPGTVDRVLTFRNVHNWVKDNNAEGMFRVFFRMLKPGGVLGVTEHRATPGTDLETMKKTGYVTEKYVVALAEQAGFQVLDRSEVNANSKDKKDYPDGVWSLPPTLRTCKKAVSTEQKSCEARYRAVGESDRMTIAFVKR